MALENKYNLTVNLKAKRYGGVVPNVTANDNTVFEIQIIDDTVAYPLLGTYRYTLVTYKKNKPSVIREGSLTSEELVRFELGSSEGELSGKVEAMVQIYDEEDNRISSAPLTYNVIGDPSLNGSLPADETTLVIANESLLTESIEKSEQAMARVDDLITQAPQPSEVVDARGGEVTLGARLNNVTSQLAQKATKDPKRPLVSTSDVTITVGSGNYTTIQSALDEIPLLLKHKYTVIIPDGNYVTENLKVPAYNTSDPISVEGSAAHLNILGNGTTPANVIVGSIFVSGVVGVSEPFIRGMTIDHVTPHVNEPYGIALMGAKGAQIYDVAFTPNMGAKIGIGAYESFVKVKNIDFTNLRHGLGVKRGGSILAFDLKGTCEFLIESQGGEVTLSGNLANTKRIVEYKGGILNTRIYDMDRGRYVDGYESAKIDPREDVRVLMPLNHLVNKYALDLSGYQLDGKVIGNGTPSIITDSKNKKWIRFTGGDSPTGQYLEIKSHDRIKFSTQLFMKVKVKFNTVGEWSISKNMDYELRYKHSSTAWQVLIKDTGGNLHFVNSQLFGSAVVGEEYTLIGYFQGTNLTIQVKKESTGEIASATTVLTAGTTIRQTDYPLLINASDTRPDGDTKIRSIANVDLREFILFENIPSYFNMDGIKDNYNWDYTSLAVSPYNPKIYNAMDISAVLGTTATNPTTTQPTQWLKVVIDGAIKYIPVYS